MGNVVTAAVLVIGNEILSGRTQDTNINHIARELVPLGIQLAEVRVVPDIEDRIVEAVNALRERYTYVFTTGGIGPTHDDITSASVAKAFGVKLHRHPEAVRRLEAHYAGTDKLNEMRLRMAEIPEGAELIDNPVSAAPGFRIGNVHVMAGVPSIMKAMLDNVKPLLKGGAVVHSRTVTSHVVEGDIAQGLAEIQSRYTEMDIGSYPFMRDGKLGTSLVLRGTDEAALDRAETEVKQLIEETIVHG